MVRVRLVQVGLRFAQRNKDFQFVSRLGLEFLHKESNRLYGKSFHQLKQEARSKVITSLSEQEEYELRRFFEGTRRFINRQLYGRSPLWQEIGYMGIPQPTGYVEHHMPPQS